MALPARTVVFCVSEREEDTNAAWRLFVQTALDPERDHLTFAFVNAAGFARTVRAPRASRGASDVARNAVLRPPCFATSH